MIYMKKCLVVLMLACSLAVADPVENQLERLTELLSTGESISGFKEPIQAKSMVSDFYRLRQYRPAWGDREFSKNVLNVLAESINEGLQPEDYHYSQLLALYNSDGSTAGISGEQQAEFELLMTDGVLLYALHLIHGKVDPASMEDSWNYKKRELLPADIIASLETLVENGALVEKLNSLKPDINLYKKMRDGLAFYRQVQNNYPFVAITDTPLLKPGEQSTALPQLRNRLFEMQFLDAKESDSDIYEDSLVEAVKSFQRNHSLDVDGVIGAQTWQALNIPWQERIDKLRINLERTRWVYENAADDLVLVNIAGFTLYMFENRELVWRTEVMTGTVKNETPLFMSRFSYMEFNPTWTVPRSILQNSMINKMKANPQYLEKHDFVLYDRQGKAVNTATLDWDSLSVNNFPYTVVQQPGDKNALGLVKFIFPNSHAIYLHDTPARSLFARSSRAFSHGCVRVQDPMELARLLLNDPEKWTDESIADIVASKKRTRITIERPTEVMLMYWTTEPSTDERIKFNPDIYNRDPGVLSALNESAQ
jgi:murein L,D-transpeptidase YcbB/YkuD